MNAIEYIACLWKNYFILLYIVQFGIPAAAIRTKMLSDGLSSMEVEKFESLGI